jgi:citrate lyase subunit beta/citryl-CoA lyase
VEADLWFPFRSSIKDLGMRLIKTALFAPGVNVKVMSKAMTSKVDAVILDLEDSVPLASKQQARELVSSVISEAARTADNPDQPRIMVRTNSIDTGLLEEDITAVSVPGLDMLLIAKAENVVDIQAVSKQLDQLEKQRGIKSGRIEIGLQIETALGVYNCFNLIKASSRVTLTCIGTAQDGDLQNDLACSWSIEGLEMLYARSKVLLDTRAAGKAMPIDGVFANLNDEEALFKDSALSARLGYVGRTIIHPKQIETVERAYGPSDSELSYYKRLIKEFEEAEKRGVAAIQMDDKLIDYAMYRQAKRIVSLEKGEL